MSQKRIFFVTGLPRRRASSLANFLTYGHSFCFHELSRNEPHWSGMKKTLDAVDMGAVGTSDSGFLNYYHEALRDFPEAALVTIRRDPEEAASSLDRLLPDQH